MPVLIETQKMLKNTVLLKRQTEALPHLAWLLGGPRGSGKTFLVAYYLVLHAIKNPNDKIYLDDKSEIRVSHANRYLVEMVEKICNDNNLDYRIYNNGQFKIYLSVMGKKK